MKRETITQMLNGLEDRYVGEAAAFRPGRVQESPERIVPMKKKRIITLALAAALLLSLGAAAYAIGVARSVASRDMEGAGEISDLSELSQVEETVGYPVTAPEAFSNGYVFDSLSVRGEAVYSEDDQVEREYYGVHLVYAKAGFADICLDLNPDLGPSAVEPSRQRSVNGVGVSLCFDRYKVVPEDYVKTEDDLAGEAAGHFYISFGADEITEFNCASASFVLDGVEYSFSRVAADADTLEELAQMAAELIAAAKG